MQTVSEILGNSLSSNKPISTIGDASTSTGSVTVMPGLLEARFLVMIWRKFTSFYGHKWHSVQGKAILANGQLSYSARCWQSGLAGVNEDCLRRGILVALDACPEWPPTLGEFRRFCLVGHPAEVPSLEAVLSMLVQAHYRDGSLVDRYCHPLAYAVACRFTGGVSYLFKTYSTPQLQRLIKPYYELYTSCGWPDFPSFAYEIQAVLPVETRQSSKETALLNIDRLRQSL